MKLNKKKINGLLAQWIKWDGELWGNLREIQLKFLYDRIVLERSFADLAAIYKVQVSKLRPIFSAILFKIEQSHGKEFSDLLRKINTDLEAKELGLAPQDNEFNIKKVWLN